MPKGGFFMLSKLENLLRMSKNGNNNMQEESAVDDSNFIPFSFEGEDFYVVLRSNVMVFDSEKTLIYTIDFNELALSDNDFMKAVNKVVNDNSNEKICLYVNKVSGVESLTFTSLFDATYIFRKLVRLASRDSEGILSIVIEKDAKVIRSYKNERLDFEKSMGKSDLNEVEDREGRNKNKTEYIATLSRVEDMVDDIIGNNVLVDGVQTNDEKIKKCIDLLSTLIEDSEDAE